MSLINDVLKDLERRQGKTPEASGPVRHARPAPGHRARHWPLWLLAAVAAGLVLHLSLDEGRTPPSRPGEGGPLTAQADANRTAERPPTGSKTTSDQPSSPSEPVELLASASTTPETATSPQAEAASAQDRRQEGSDANAQTDSDTPPDKEEHAPSPEAEPRAEVLAEKPRPAPPETAVPSQSQPRTPVAQADDSIISIRRSDESDGQTDPLDAAKRLLARGQLQRAESRLRQLVDEQPGLTEAHELLANTLIQRRRPESAIEALESGLRGAREPASLAALLGRLLLESGEVARARNVLDKYAPPLSDAPDYHLLLAAAHRQAGDHEQAAQHYRRLSETLPRRGAVWIGLGASLESLDRPGDAVSAYNRALESDDDRAIRFARQRLTALEPITGDPQ